MVEKNGQIYDYERALMNYYKVTDKDFENEQEVYIDNQCEDDLNVRIYSKDGDLIEIR